MKKRRKEKLVDALLAPINPAAVIFLGIYTVLWGLWVANPWWSVFKTAKMFGLMAHLAPEVFWGCLAITCGCITIYGAYKRKYKPLVRGAQVSAWHWGMISFFYFLGDFTNTGGITSLIFAVYAAFIILNLRVNHKDNPDSAEILHHNSK